MFANKFIRVVKKKTMTDLKKLYTQLRTEADVKHKILHLQNSQRKLDTLACKLNVQQLQADSAEFCLADSQADPQPELFEDLHIHWKNQVTERNHTAATLAFNQSEFKDIVQQTAPRIFAFEDTCNCRELVTSENFYLMPTPFQQIWRIINENEAQLCKSGPVLYIPPRFRVQKLNSIKDCVKLSPLFCNQNLFALALQQETQASLYLQVFVEVVATVLRFETKLFQNRPQLMYIHGKSMACDDEPFHQFITLCEFRVVPLNAQSSTSSYWNYMLLDDHFQSQPEDGEFLIPICTTVRIPIDGYERKMCIDPWLASIFAKYYVLLKQEKLTYEAYKHLFRTQTRSQP